jgi:hypothetical protein
MSLFDWYVVNQLIEEDFLSPLLDTLYQPNDKLYVNDLTFYNSKLILKSRLSNILYKYPVSAYFYNAYINTSLYNARSYRSYKKDIVLFDIAASGRFKNFFTLRIFKRKKNFKYSSNLRDTYFESQEFTHSFLFEVIWAIFPTVIICYILVPSLYLLYSLDDSLDPQLTIKVIGHQWYWSYEFDNWVDYSPLKNILGENNLVKWVSYKFDSILF